MLDSCYVFSALRQRPISRLRGQTRIKAVLSFLRRMASKSSLCVFSAASIQTRLCDALNVYRAKYPPAFFLKEAPPTTWETPLPSNGVIKAIFAKARLIPRSLSPELN